MKAKRPLRKNDALKGEATKIEWRDNHAFLGGDPKEGLRERLANTKSFASLVAVQWVWCLRHAIH